MKNFVAAAASLLLFGAANAAPITIGGTTVDSDNFADGAIETGGSVSQIVNIVDGDISTFGTINSADEFQATFSQGMISNVAGFDLFVLEFGTVEAPRMSLTSGGTSIVGTQVAQVPNLAALGVFSTLTVFAFDLSSLGVAASTAVSSVFFTANGVSPDITAIAAEAFTAAPVPVPAAAFLFGPALLVLRRLRRKTA